MVRTVLTDDHLAAIAWLVPVPLGLVAGVAARWSPPVARIEPQGLAS